MEIVSLPGLPLLLVSNLRTQTSAAFKTPMYGMVMFFSQIHKENSKRIERLKGVGKVSSHKIAIIFRNGSEVISQMYNNEIKDGLYIYIQQNKKFLNF